MNKDLVHSNLLLKHEANGLLFEKGLFNILSACGTPHLSGSYALDLMTWRDLDIYLQTDHLTMNDFFALGAAIANAFEPVKMSFRNELLAQTPGLPTGLYWGVYLGNEKAGAWKMDIWAVSTPECERLLEYCSGIQQKLTPEVVLPILDIKSQCWQDPAYRRIYSSTDIYDAVLLHNVRDIDEFKKYLNTIRKPTQS